MNSEKRILLEQTYSQFLKEGTGLSDMDTLDKITDPQIMGFGTTADEIILSLAQFRELVARQKEQMQGLAIEWITTPIRHYYSADENTAIFADDIRLHIGSGNEKIEMQLRFSVIMVFENGKWIVIHWHGSKPENVQSETDTFGIDDWKKKTAELEKMVAERTAELNQSIHDLKATQTQLIQSEKMASLGELTAGIAHEIQNPLNFVNNFSEVSIELIEELKVESRKSNVERDQELEIELLSDIEQNLEKINHHGKRADAIVKGMLQHSRSSSGQKEQTDLNALTDEYLRLAHHGLRAKDKNFNATIHSDFDENLEKISIIPQDIGRVVLNLLTNAFYAVNEKKRTGVENYAPSVSVSTRKLSDKIEIRVTDNGNGMPKHIAEKIFQPFFTTKPTGQGTGLGLSLSYDIVTQGHGGELKVETKDGEGTTFIIELPR